MASVSAPLTRSTGSRVRRFVGRIPASGWVVIAIVLLCFIGPLVMPFGPNDLGVGGPFEAPSAAHWFGTDDLGRDLLVRVLAGGQISLTVGIGATALSLIVGLIWGTTAAAYGGWVDTVLMRTGDAVMAIPQILFALVCVAAFHPSVLSMTLVIGLLLAPTTARLVRSTAVSELTSDYVTAARATGAGRGRIISVEVLPNIVPPVLVQAATNLVEAIMLEATLSFVGLGIQPPDASWGTLLLQGYAKMYNSIWFMAFPAAAIIVTLVALTLLSERLGAMFDLKEVGE
ncbi:ABC transporter permease [Leifsonia shinshuensis]|uniref:ABC transporter permease n=1 Tax=Leifsonia shinshuensis TaxID=150026 RepID=UPI001F508ABF|nr:ABC transporter permease [Leifsonia shinshuensis]MCI0158041.1 ABC transporter permease [Leifsonia shinshuensis]